MYTTQPWTIRQYAGFSTAEESNAFYRRNLAAGQKGLSVAFDLPTHRGYDSDHPRVAGDVGMAGRGDRLDLRHAAAVRRHPAGPDERVDDDERRRAAGPGAVHRRGRGTGGAAGAAGRDHPERHPQGVHGPQHLHLPARSRRCGSSPTSSPTPRRECRSSTRSRSPATTSRRPGPPPTSSSPTPWPTAWSTCKAGVAAGLDIDAFAPRLSFFWAIGMNFFTEVAKLRAARALWYELVAPFGPRNPKSSALRAHSQTSGWSLTAQDPFNNVARTCIEAMAATQGHTQSLHTNALDEAIALPTDFSARIARNTQLLLQQESGTTAIIDPWGGSYYVERLTADLAARAREHLDEVDAAGGMAKAIEAGIPKLRIEEAAARTQARIDSARADRRRGQQLSHRRRGRLRRPQDRQPGGPGRPDRQAGAPARQPGTRTGSTAALDALTAAAAAGQFGGPCRPVATTCWRWRSMRPGPAATVGEISMALEKVFGRHTAVIRTISGVYRSEAGSSDAIDRRARRDRRVRTRRGPPTADPGGEDGPGRPRPRAEGHRHRVRRPRLRRRRRPAVRHPGGGRPAGGGRGRAHRRGVHAGRRAPDPGARAARRAGRRSAGRTS